MTDYQRGVTEGEQRAAERMAVLRQQEQTMFATMMQRLKRRGAHSTPRLKAKSRHSLSASRKKYCAM